MRPDYCPCENEMPDPCPVCGATVDGVGMKGVCKALFQRRRPESLVQIVLIDRRDGKVVASTR